MSLAALVTDWEVPTDLVAVSAEAGKVYVLPMLRDVEGLPAYRPDSMALMKSAANDDVPIEYAAGAEERKFVDHFSAAPDVLEIWLGLAGPITDAFLFALGYALNSLLRRRGVKETDLSESKVKVGIARINPENGEMRGVKVEGSKDAVIDTIRELRDRG